MFFHSFFFYVFRKISSTIFLQATYLEQKLRLEVEIERFWDQLPRFLHIQWNSTCFSALIFILQFHKPSFQFILPLNPCLSTYTLILHHISTLSLFTQSQTLHVIMHLIIFSTLLVFNFQSLFSVISNLFTASTLLSRFPVWIANIESLLRCCSLCSIKENPRTHILMDRVHAYVLQISTL